MTPLFLGRQCSLNSDVSMRPKTRHTTEHTPAPVLFRDDLELVRGAVAGDEGAMRRLASRLARIPAMIGARDRLMGGRLSAHDIDDASQEAIAAIWAKLSTYNGTCPIEGWAHGFALRLHLKALSARTKTGTGVLPGADSGPYAEDSTVILGDEYRLVHDSIDGLQGTQAFIVRERHFEDQSFVKIAESLGLSPATVKTKYYRGLARLRDRLAPFWVNRQRGHPRMESGSKL